jgi:hypothetical protein
MEGFFHSQLERLSDLFVRKGVPVHIGSDNGSEFTATRLREWLEWVGMKPPHLEPRSPWENGYVESFNGKLPHELLARGVFDTLLEAKVPIERCRGAHNTVRPHSSLGYRLRATESHRSYRLLRYTSASGQGRAIGRAALMIDTESISGGRSVVGHIAPDFGGPTYEDGWRVLLTDELNAHVDSQALFAV